jgi:hypothetical protein
MWTCIATEGLGTVLGVWAHPDDEAYLSAGIMGALRDAGHRRARPSGTGLPAVPAGSQREATPARCWPTPNAYQDAALS